MGMRTLRRRRQPGEVDDAVGVDIGVIGAVGRIEEAVLIAGDHQVVVPDVVLEIRPALHQLVLIGGVAAHVDDLVEVVEAAHDAAEAQVGVVD